METETDFKGEYEDGDMFKSEDGDWVVVVESNEEDETYEVAEKVGEEVEYYSCEDLEQLCEEGVFTELGRKMDESLFQGVFHNNGTVDIRRILSFANMEVDS